MDLRRQVSRKLPKKKAAGFKKRADRKYLIDRTYKDYKSFLLENPGAFVVQMDTVYNDESNGPFIQTFKFVRSGLLFALYHTEKTSFSMLKDIVLNALNVEMLLMECRPKAEVEKAVLDFVIWCGLLRLMTSLPTRRPL